MPNKLKLGIIGCPLSHSKSPQMQKAGLKYLNINGEYERYEIQTENFPHEIKNILENLDGFNITIPHKEQIISYLNQKDTLVERIGACNTIRIKDGKILGFNTDYHGFIKSLTYPESQEKLPLEGKKAALLGAGGAAKAVLAALVDLGLDQIDVYVRNIKKSQQSLESCDFMNSNINLKLLSTESSFEEVSILINSTPIGQGRLENSMPIELNQLKSLDSDTVVYDLIYPKTKLLREAEKLKLRTIDGSMMLVHQGAQALSLWTGKDIDKGLIKVMKEAFENG